MMPKILENHYVIAVHNVKESATFYVEVLGFTVVAEPLGWVLVKKDGCMIMLGECPEDLPPGDLGSHSYFAYLCVDDVDAYFVQVKSHGVEIVSELGDRPWGMREFGLRTPDGHRVMIGQEIGRES